jgi:hypothetical protein
MPAPTFKPVYLTDEEVSGAIIKPTGESGFSTEQINPQYCLSADSAQELVKVLQAGFPQYSISTYDEFPQHMAAGSPFAFNKRVPWIKIVNPGGKDDGSDQVYVNNAGQFCAYFASASMTQQDPPQYNNPEVAWRNVTQDIGEGLQGG